MRDIGTAEDKTHDLDDLLSRSDRFGEMEAKLDTILEYLKRSQGSEGPEAPSPVLASEIQDYIGQLDASGPADPHHGRIESVAAVAEKQPPGEPTESLAEHVTRIEERLSRLPSIETTIAELLSRFGAVETTHVEPIRQAAKLEVRRLVEEEREALGVPPSVSAAIDQARAECQAAMEKRDDASQRLHSLLEVLSGNLERITDRLDVLEHDAQRIKQQRETADASDGARAKLRGVPVRPGRRSSTLLEALGFRPRVKAAFA